MSPPRLETVLSVSIAALAGASTASIASVHLVRAYGGAILLAGILCVLALVSLRRDLNRPKRPMEPLHGDPEPERESWQQQLVAFAVALKPAASREAVHRVIAEQLPALLKVERMFLTVRFGSRRHTIAHNHPAASDANPLFTGEGTWTTFPLYVDRHPVGVLGVDTTGGPLRPEVRQSMPTVTALLVDTLQTLGTLEELRERSSVEPLTGCATRHAGMVRLRAELNRAQRTSRPLAVLMVDLDNFKTVNDKLGHPAGDAVLTAVGGALVRSLRASDVVCRWGGDEFLIVLPETDLDHASSVATAVVNRIGATVTQYHTATIRVSATIGITIAEPGDDVDVVIGRADAALYTARQNGRNPIGVSTKSKNSVRQ